MKITVGPSDDIVMDSEIETPFLHLDTVNGAVDYRGQPVLRSRSGYWRSAWFTISVEVGERMAFFGIESNLITFLTGSLRQSTAAAAAGNVNMWEGTASLLPLLGAFVADSYLGRYRTIIDASLVCILALAFNGVHAVCFEELYRRELNKWSTSTILAYIIRGIAFSV